jgi:hypothetical protein
LAGLILLRAERPAFSQTDRVFDQCAGYKNAVHKAPLGDNLEFVFYDLIV